MKTIVFAPAVFNLAETTRMLEVAKQLQYTYHCQFIGFSQTFAFVYALFWPFEDIAVGIDPSSNRQQHLETFSL